MRKPALRWLAWTGFGLLLIAAAYVLLALLCRYRAGQPFPPGLDPFCAVLPLKDWTGFLSGGYLLFLAAFYLYWLAREPGNFEPKLKYLTSTMGFAYSDTSECIKDLLANANSITDSKSFDKAAGAYQKRLSKRLAQEAKRDRERERRDRNPKREGGDAPPQGGKDRDCFRNGDPFGCQPKHP